MSHQGKSHFFLLKNNAVRPDATGMSHWLEFLPDHVYCLIPSFHINEGKAVVYTEMPEFVKEFVHCMEIVPNFPSSSTRETNNKKWNFKPDSQTFKLSTKCRLQSEKSYVKRNPKTRSKELSNKPQFQCLFCCQ